MVKLMIGEKVLGVAEELTYITELENDTIVIGTAENARGCLFNGENYHLKGAPITKQAYSEIEAVEITEEEFNELKPQFEINPQYGLQNAIVNQIKDDAISEVQEAVKNGLNS